ncbi:hypothetical protein [Halorussus salinisoli]|uniref:hypothetical protein n=1 Tax=Halorussus salinisoli TaxID=2558242 RepID=UPI0010C1FECC|nr:hypothetical protein [Halorussus salinisoli]
MTTGITTSLNTKTGEITVFLIDFSEDGGLIDKCVLTPDEPEQGYEAWWAHVDSLADDCQS